MSKISWIFFDCFNTLVDDFDPTGDVSGVKPLGDTTVREGIFDRPEDFHQSYIEWRKEEWCGDSWHEVVLPDRLRKTLQKGRPPTSSMEQVVEELLDIFHETYPHDLRVTPGAQEMIQRLGRRYRTCLISNFFLPDYPESVLQRFGLSDTFDFIIDSAQLGFKKPGNEIYHHALQKAGLTVAETSQVVFVGDSLVNDVIKPSKLGMRGIHFDRSADRPNSKPTPSGIESITSWDQFLPD